MPWPGAVSTTTLPPDCLTKPCTWDSPSPVPWPCGLVVKNGSNTWATTSGAMPVPVSATAISAYSPGMVSGGRAPGARTRLTVVTVKRPPVRPSQGPLPTAIASRAFTARFSRAFSNWFGSA